MDGDRGGLGQEPESGGDAGTGGDAPSTPSSGGGGAGGNQPEQPLREPLIAGTTSSSS